MWEQTMSELHHALFTPGASELDVDLGPVIDRILTSVEERLPVEIPRPDDASVTLITIPDSPLLNGLSTVSPWASWSGPAALVLLARSESTRLNSSHVAISYAVFCLQKKKTLTA